METTEQAAAVNSTPEIVWAPGEQQVEASRIAKFMRLHKFAAAGELYEASVADPAWFWDAVVSFLGIHFEQPYVRVLNDSDPKFATWFEGGTTNIAYNCVDRHVRAGRGDTPAVVWEMEDLTTGTLTYQQLQEQVSRLAAAMQQRGVGVGDRVVLYLPMVPEVVVSFYACVAIGAIAVPVFSGFAAPAIQSRIEHSEAKMVICAAHTSRRGKRIDAKAAVDEALRENAAVTSVIVVGADAEGTSIGDRAEWYHDVMGAAPDGVAPIWLPSEQPVMLAYTSGTTGAPKAAVHVHGGLLVKMAQEAAFQTDVGEGDILYWVTDMGWIMGPWELIGAHANAATVMLVEGAPDYPTNMRLWESVARHKATVLGVSPTLIRALHAATSDNDLAQLDLSAVRIFGSTGEPWNPEPYLWLFRRIGNSNVPIINLSGGTEVGACFLSPTPLSQLTPTTLGGPALGMAVEVWDTEGKPLGPGEGVGELVCIKPWPGMTRGFWRDDNNERYVSAYWSRWPDVWVHGDWASIDKNGLWYLHGRSDDTINVAGKRIGPAEYESILVDNPVVAEAAAVGIPHPVKGETVHCFVVCPTFSGDRQELVFQLRREVGEQLGKAFMPESVQIVAALPKTRSAKIVRRAIRAAVIGAALGDLSSVENPECLAEIAQSR